MTTFIGEGPKYTMGDKRNPGPHNNNPGPGEYNLGDDLIHERNPHWKFSNNPHSAHDGPQINSNDLGPGSYNLPTIFGEGLKYTLGQRQNNGPHDDFPGPAHYSPEDGFTHEQTPQWKFSKNPHSHNGP